MPEAIFALEWVSKGKGLSVTECHRFLIKLVRGLESKGFDALKRFSWQKLTICLMNLDCIEAHRPTKSSSARFPAKAGFLRFCVTRIEGWPCACRSLSTCLAPGKKEKQTAKARRGLSLVTLCSLTCFDTCCLNEARLRCTIWVYDNDVCRFHLYTKSQQNELPKQFNWCAKVRKPYPTHTHTFPSFVYPIEGDEKKRKKRKKGRCAAFGGRNIRCPKMTQNTSHISIYILVCV